MEWFQAPLDSLFGIPAFWIQRIAKLIQFTAGLVIMVDIVGQERVNQFTIELANATRRNIESGQIGRHLRASYRTLLYLAGLSGAPKILAIKVLKTPDAEILAVLKGYVFLSLFMGFSAACLSYALADNTDWLLISAIAGAAFISSLVFSPITVALSLSVIAFLTQRVVLPGLDNVLRMVNIQGVYQPLLTISLCLFVFAFLLDFSVS